MDKDTLSISARDLAEIIHGDYSGDSNPTISSVAVSSRSLRREAAFFALKGAKNDGHEFVRDAFQQGASLAVVSRSWLGRQADIVGIPTIAVGDPLQALQLLARWWRERYEAKVIAITGSSGKTEVKDLLGSILSSASTAYQSPGSFNSQIGVPLSLLRMPLSPEHAIFEVGVSEAGQMSPLREIVRPAYGILTNVGWAHISSFGSQANILDEKLNLFSDLPEGGWLLVPHDLHIPEGRLPAHLEVIRFGQPSTRLPYIEATIPKGSSADIRVCYPSGDRYSSHINLLSPYTVKNVEIAIAAAHLLGIGASDIHSIIESYAPVVTSTEIWQSPSGITIINDSASADFLSAKLSLETLRSITPETSRSIYIYGGIPSPSGQPSDVNRQVGQLAAEWGVDQLVLFGKERLSDTSEAYTSDRQAQGHTPEVSHYSDIAQVRSGLTKTLKWGDVVLVQGFQGAGIDQVASELIDVMAPNRFYVNLEAIRENVAVYRQLVGPSVSILAMVKALAYGTEVLKLANLVESFGVDAFGVSTVDEGIALRRSGVAGEILVMHCTPPEVEKLLPFGLTPVVYSDEIFEVLAESTTRAGKSLNVHLEVYTGMVRTGVFPEEAIDLAEKIRASGYLNLKGVMTHFAGADDPDQDDQTRDQIEKFRAVAAELRERGFDNLVCHAAATSGTARFPEARLDMVRVGLGLYGLYPSPAVQKAQELVLAVSLVSRISRIQNCAIGSRIGYGGTYVVTTSGFRAAVVPLGYNDGLPWSVSNRGYVLINGQRADIVGRISMDMMVVDVSNIADASVGSDVLVYGDYGGQVLRPEEVATWGQSMPYELLVRLGSRVQKLYVSH